MADFMKEITRENISEIKSELKNKTVVLYGAGTTGKQALQLLSELNISADFFVDDDAAKQGKFIEGLKCLSFPELKSKSERSNVSVILTSVFSGTILEKLKPLSVDCYAMYDMLINDCPNAFEELISMKQDKSTWNKKWIRVKNIFEDEESLRVWNVIHHVADTRDTSKKYFTQICSREEHYFVSPIPTLLSNDSVLVDCGAYTGDMLGQLANNNIPFGKIYEIEANPLNNEKIRENISRLKLEEKVVVINCGLYDKNSELDFFISYGNAAGSRFVKKEDEFFLKNEGYIIKIPVRKPDNLINEKIDFFKTDIEGAEMVALHGAKNLLLSSRPILAISVYHSLDDMVDIPIYLNDLLKNYRFFLRHHSFVIGETVLYGIPCEKWEG